MFTVLKSNLFRVLFVCLFSTTLFICQFAYPSEITFDIWYGDEQHFGVLGHPQRWVNVLGHASPAEEIASLSYTLNNRSPVMLSYHEDKKRIATDGDFNIELDRNTLHSGENIVEITAFNYEGERFTHTVKVHYTFHGKAWELPYRINWSKVTHINDVAQVVDGKWELTKDGIRSVEQYYDRVITFGDDSWRNYEVTTTVIFHDFTPPNTNPNATGVTHAAIATRWPGHDIDGNQPNVKWFPFGATAEFRIGQDLQQCRWRIFDGKIMRKENRYYAEEERRRIIQLEKKYWMKHRVETLDDGSSLYQVKLWEYDKPEPKEWDLKRIEPNDFQYGSALLIAHHTDVTFGDVSVKPVQ